MPQPAKSKPRRAFDVQVFLDSAGVARKMVEYRRGEVIFTQGDPYRDGLKVNGSLLTVVLHD